MKRLESRENWLEIGSRWLEWTINVANVVYAAGRIRWTLLAMACLDSGEFNHSR